MTYREYFEKFNENDCEEVVTHITNANAGNFLYENAPRLYCPDQTIEETFAFRTWTMRKHIRKTEVGFVITEFLPDVAWAAKYNTINAPLTHHLNEFRWLKNANDFLDYIRFFITGEASAYATQSAFAYQTPALTAMYNYCLVSANEGFLRDNVEAFEKYFLTWEEKHLTRNGLYWSIDDREGTEFSISGTAGTVVTRKVLKGFRPLMNACMCADALSLSRIFEMVGNRGKSDFYKQKSHFIKNAMDEKMWDGDFYKAVHPLEQDFDKEIDCRDIPEGHNVRELVGYIPFAFNLPDKDKQKCFAYLKDEKVFQAKTGFATADISHERFMYSPEHACTWNGKVWPYATSYVLNACIELLNNYSQEVITNGDLYNFTKKYAEMHYSIENGKKINFIDEVMMPYESIWVVREQARSGKKEFSGGKNRGRDYNHSTFIDLVLRGLCGVDTQSQELKLKPRIKGIWKWFKIENLTFKKQTYNVYYDEDGTVFNKGKGVIIEKL